MLKYTTKRFEAECGLDGFVADCVDVPKFQKFCRECPSYGNSWMCPPFSFDPMDIWRGYERIKLIGVQISIDYPSEETSNEAVGEVLKAEKTKLMNELWAAEREVPGSLGLFAGSCSLCKPCAREAGEPCRIPERARHSIESIGAIPSASRFRTPIVNSFGFGKSWSKGRKKRPKWRFLFLSGKMSPAIRSLPI